MSTKLTHATAALRVCVDRAAAGNISGRVVGQRLTAPIAFADVGDLMLQVETVLDVQQFPQAYQRTRTFAEPSEGEAVPAALNLEEAMSAQEVDGARGAHATFLVQVLTRRNTTWQGSVDWLDGTPAEPFSSALDLIKCVDRHIFHSEERDRPGV